MYFISQSTTNFSNTLLKNGVKAIILRSSSDWGLVTLGIGVPCSNFQDSGHWAIPFFAELIIPLNRTVRGGVISGPNSATSWKVAKELVWNVSYPSVNCRRPTIASSRCNLCLTGHKYTTKLQATHFESLNLFWYDFFVNSKQLFWPFLCKLCSVQL